MCRSWGAQAAAQAAASPADAPAASGGVLVLKHCLRDEYDELTDIARLYRIKVRQ
jgi:hypothetical protein